MRPEWIACWNVSDMGDDRLELINATSNAHERYNRHFNGIMGDHPNLVVFAHKLHDVSLFDTL